MITIKNFLILITLTFIVSSNIGCNDEILETEIPPAAFPDVVVNLDLPQYQDLNIDQGHVTLNEGVRGIILYRVNASTYNAFEVNCSYQPYDACANVIVDQSNLFLRDDCCGSTFSVQDGQPTRGPAQFSLRRYTVVKERRTLTITDQPIN
ncbi:hypothetical protein E1176_11270 [Fulvivirga sp. RKSG066]|uniref:hypothetical protein n=1 Tax=Fulvivirga aurantia TaxID=2529383 RepID=UPI0012BD1CA4|nr:hypothetical protein [Fulvivirga aurantia]MTI21600.1 hypothetical protein [Fulvivirga aurantia]